MAFCGMACFSDETASRLQGNPGALPGTHQVTFPQLIRSVTEAEICHRDPSPRSVTEVRHRDPSPRSVTECPASSTRHARLPRHNRRLCTSAHSAASCFPSFSSPLSCVVFSIFSTRFQHVPAFDLTPSYSESFNLDTMPLINTSSPLYPDTHSPMRPPNLPLPADLPHHYPDNQKTTASWPRRSLLAPPLTQPSPASSQFR